MFEIEFLNPEFLFLLILVPLVYLYTYPPNWLIRAKFFKTPSFLKISTIRLLNFTPSLKTKFYKIPFILRLLAYILLIFALARPISRMSWKNTFTEAVDIVISLDLSVSMLAQDFKPNRLEAAKEEALKFVSSRKNDRIGLVVFGGNAFTQCPLTIDHEVIKNLFGSLSTDLTSNGTAIGMGLATAINRLKQSIAKSKVIILLTDGMNNAGAIDPLSVSKIAKQLGIKIYAIGIGTIGTAPYPFKDERGRIVMQNVPVQIDEKLLRKITKETQGKYFRATDNRRLQRIYKEIDRLEKTSMEVKEYSNKKEEFFWFIYIAGIFLFLEKILEFTYFRTVN